MDKEEVLEVEDQIQKALQKESKDAKEEKEENEKAAAVSTVPATPVTKEAKILKEEFDEDTTAATKTASASSSSTTHSRDVSMPSDKESDSVRSPPITPTVPPPSKKAEGSKQL